MHLSGQRSAPGLKGNLSRTALHVPSSKRPESKNGLPWNGVLGVCIVLSLSVNIYSLTLNRYQFSLLNQLTFSQGIEADQRRLSSGAASSAVSAGAASSSHAVDKCAPQPEAAGGHAGPHPHDALLYLFNALSIGAAVMQLSARYPILQQTIVLFVIGFVSSLIMKGMNLMDKVAVWGDSYEMWMNIDPHLLLFTLLPALLAGDAMTIDTSVAKQVGMQCLYLAGPGVLIGGFSTAIFLNVYIQWESDASLHFLLSLCAGSILCATDPVAVVALLKELGASPMITVQIQGESLLNDGTAIVLYLISYAMLSGKEFDWLDITAFLLEKAVMAFAIGLFIGYFFFAWIRFASDKLEHSSSMIQIVLTLCCAYWSFILVEGVLGLSGVLATVASSLVLAHHMWPYVVSEESMLHVWHTFEALGNIIVFFLAGSITGFIVVDIDYIDWLHLVVIYFVLLTIRATLLFASRPILRLLHPDRLPVSWQDATLMTWGGLRGAVGLALAIQVNNGRAPYVGDDSTKTGEPQIHSKDAQRLLFFVSGIAFLTTLVNATTAPMLVAKLKITALPAARKTLLRMFHQQLVNWSEDSSNPPEVTKSLRHMLHEAAEELEHTSTADDGPTCQRTASGTSLSHDQEHEHLKGPTHQTAGDGPVKLVPKAADGPYQENSALVSELMKVRARFEQISDSKDLQLLAGAGEMPKNMLGKVDGMIELIKDESVDVGMAKVVNQAYLTMVYNNYWKLIESGKLRPGSSEAEVLLTSVRISLSPYRADLDDFNYVQKKILGKDDNESEDAVTAELGAMADTGKSFKHRESCIGNPVASAKFNISIALAILLNSIVVCLEELMPPSNDDEKLPWLIIDGFFTAVFVVEFVMKLIVLKCDYFRDGWNRFDFVLVVVGVFGLVMNIFTQGGSAKLAGQTRLMRLARVLRTMRFLRIFRLFNARLGRDKFISLDLAKRMGKITAMNCFISAHVLANSQLLEYYGGNGKLDTVDESELARCILQGQVAVYKALIAAADTQAAIGIDILFELTVLNKRKHITEGLHHFVEKAHADGAISATETHAILHPLNHQISTCMKALNSTAEGVVNMKRTSTGSDSCAKNSLVTARMTLAERLGDLEERVEQPGEKEEATYNHYLEEAAENPAAASMAPGSSEPPPTQPEVPGIPPPLAPARPAQPAVPALAPVQPAVLSQAQPEATESPALSPAQTEPDSAPQLPAEPAEQAEAAVPAVKSSFDLSFAPRGS